MVFRTWISSAALALIAITGAGCANAAPPETAALVPQAASTSRYTAPGPYKVETERGKWHDAKRDRDVPWLIRYPQDTDGPRPVMVFSHGLGGSREGLPRMSEFLVSHGYIVVHVQHPGSDVSMWKGVRPDPATVDRGAMLKTASDPAVMLNRFADIPFAMGELGKMAVDGKFAGKIDMGRVAMSGHSFGAVTTQVAAGQVFKTGAAMPADGFRAFIAMSPSGDRDGDDKAAFANVTKPFLMMTGTEDGFALNPSVETAEDRLQPYYGLPEGLPAVLVNLTGGDHFVFSGSILTRGKDRPLDPRHHEIIDAAVLAFLDAYLMDDPGAREWLANGLAGLARTDASIETRNVTP
ncbi:hypothetical protein K1X12_11290 [Hyphomonas sp. WL0036]|uniref:alpha/beta hydrolase family protein n=1 Tax=Hyphomonas sediminis TaxID=2866160 RepID=UPI001C82476B|nr:hypothetical protein [Hyphomonas sediminis]MBY9067488.1 hypothetical protein [Hyphomonas sediminis]